jgi:hypothetical protein
MRKNKSFIRILKFFETLELEENEDLFVDHRLKLKISKFLCDKLIEANLELL